MQAWRDECSYSRHMNGTSPEHGGAKTNAARLAARLAKKVCSGDHVSVEYTVHGEAFLICTVVLLLSAESNDASSRPLVKLATWSSPRATPKSAWIERDNYDHVDEGFEELRNENTSSNVEPTTASSVPLRRAILARSVLGVGVSKSWVTSRDMLNFVFNSEVTSFTRLDLRPMAKKGRSSSNTTLVAPRNSENGVSSPTWSPNRRFSEASTMLAGTVEFVSSHPEVSCNLSLGVSRDQVGHF